MCTPRHTPDINHELLKQVFVVHSHRQCPISKENFPVLEYGKIEENPSQESVCFRCSSLKKPCPAKTMTCLICFQNIQASQLDEHMNEWHIYLKGSQPFSCGISVFIKIIGFRGTIAERAYGTSDLDVNQSVVHNKQSNILTCFCCVKEYSSEENLKEHCSENNFYYCDVCPLIFKTRCAMERHNYFCNGGGVLHCKKCNLYFLSYLLYARHIDNSHVEFVKCELCNNVKDLNLRQYKDHLSTVHDKKHLCSCLKIFETSDLKKQHLHEMHAEKKQLCAYCGCSFFSNHLLRKHIDVVHTSRRARKYKPRKHDSNASKSNPMKVKPKKSNHKEHKRKITGDSSKPKAVHKKILYCGLCNDFQAFTMTKYKQHLRTIHQKYFLCEICYLSFETFNLKKQHFEEMHSDKLHLCSCCGHSFVANRSLREHMARAHPTEKKTILQEFVNGECSK
jgi:hypothetical protein